VLLGERTYVVGTAEELAKLVPPEEAIAERGRVITYECEYATPSAISEFFNQLADDLGIEVSPALELNMVIFKGVKDDAIEAQIREQLALVDTEQPPITTLYTLEFLRPDAAKAALENFVPDVTVATAGPDVPLQVIQIRGSPDAIAQAETVLQKVDVEPVVEPLPPEALATEIVLIDHANPTQLQTTTQTLMPNVEIILHSGAAEESELQMEGLRDAGIMYSTGTLVVRGEQSAVDAAVRFIKSLDVPLPRVQISASIVEVSYTRNATVGLIWSLPGIVFREATAVDGWRFGKFIRDPLTFSSILTAVDTKARTRILSNPKIVVESTKRGSILVGEIIPFETSVPGEGTVTRSLNFQEVGLGVDFTPVVKSDGNIQMYLRPHVSNFGEFTPSGFPRISTRETETILSARDGDTIIIGGLLQEQDIITKSGIPFLQDFPLVGELFRQRTKSRQKTEIVIMATVELLAPGAPASGG
jgi:type II secretory pathway component GspD/PulD (secretin)